MIEGMVKGLVGYVRIAGGVLRVKIVALYWS